jgi:hypothetical protein
MRCFLRLAHDAGVTTLADYIADVVTRYIAFVQQKHKWADNPHMPTQPLVPFSDRPELPDANHTAADLVNARSALLHTSGDSVGECGRGGGVRDMRAEGHTVP